MSPEDQVNFVQRPPDISAPPREPEPRRLGFCLTPVLLSALPPRQEFMFHCLRNCYVVVMNARDESSSFKIFATLNGRGENLTVVDKLKADLLQVLSPEQRAAFAEKWAEMEGLLGR